MSKPFKLLPTFSDYIASYRPQEFSIPYSIIHYIAKNPKKSEVYQKMIQSCKCFFVKNPILVIPCLWYEGEEWNICSKYRCNQSNSEKKFKLNDIFGKLWITKELSVSDEKGSVIEEFIPKVFRCDVDFLVLKNQNLAWKDFCFLSKNCNHVGLINMKLSFKDGSEVPFEMLVKQLPQILTMNYKFYPDLKNVSKNTVAEILKLPRFTELKIFRLFNLPEMFDAETLFQFIKKNKMWCNIVLSYDVPLSEGYIKKLERIIEEMHETDEKDDFDYLPIMIQFEEQTVEEHEKMLKLHESFF